MIKLSYKTRQAITEQRHMGHELKQKPIQVDDESSCSDLEEKDELGEGLLLESSENPWMDHVSWNCSNFIL